MSAQWEHNDTRARWELVSEWYDVPREMNMRRLIAYITDEMIAQVADPALLAVRTFNKLGSAPPPLAALLPPHDPNTVVYEDGWTP